MTKITVVRSDKGGAGKTMLAVNLAAGLARKGLPTLLIDFDPKSDAVVSLGLPKGQAVYDWLVDGKPLNDCISGTDQENLFVMAGDNQTYEAIERIDRSIRQGTKPGDYLSRKLAGIADIIEFDHIVIDMPPFASYWTAQPLLVADNVIVPTKPDMIDIGGAISTLTQIGLINPAIKAWIVPSIWRCGRKLDNECHAFLTNTYPGQVTECIPDSTSYPTARSHGQSIWEYSRSAKLLAPYLSLMEVL